METQPPLPLQKGTKPPIFGPCLLWPNGTMDQDATCYEGRPRAWPFLLDGDPAPPKGHNPQFSAHVPCGQTAGWIKVPLGAEIELGIGQIVLHGDPVPHPKGAQQPPRFSVHVSCGQTVAHLSYC